MLNLCIYVSDSVSALTRSRQIGDDLVLQSEEFHQIKPGLSSFKDDPKAGAESLIPLLEFAVSFVPVESRASTPINLKATAGLRLLDPFQVWDGMGCISIYARALPSHR